MPSHRKFDLLPLRQMTYSTEQKYSNKSIFLVNFSCILKFNRKNKHEMQKNIYLLNSITKKLFNLHGLKFLILS